MKQEIEITLTFPPNTGYIEKYVYIPPFAPLSSNSFSFKKIISKITDWYIQDTNDNKFKQNLKIDVKMTYLENYIPILGILTKKDSPVYETTDEKKLSYYPVSRNTYQFTITDSNGKYIEYPETIFVKLKIEFYN